MFLCASWIHAGNGQTEEEMSTNVPRNRTNFSIGFAFLGCIHEASIARVALPSSIIEPAATLCGHVQLPAAYYLSPIAGGH